MKVNVEEITSIKNKLNDSIENYNDIIMNYYNEINIISNNWKDGNSFPFFDATEETKKNAIVNYNNFKKVIHIFDSIINSYRNIGNKIEYNAELADKSVASMENTIKKIEAVIAKYYLLDLSCVSGDIRGTVINQINRCQRIKDDLINIKEKNKSIHRNIGDIENKIGNKISKVNLNYIKEESYVESHKDISDVSMNVDEVDICLKKMEMYKREEDLVLEELENSFNQIKLYYHSKNVDKLQEVIDVLIDNVKRVNAIHNDNIIKVEKHRTTYIEVSENLKYNFEELGDLR